MARAVTRSTLTPGPSSSSYRVTEGPRLKPVTAASTWNCLSTSVIAATTSSLAAERDLGGVPGVSRDAAGSRYAAVDCRGAGAATGTSNSPATPFSLAEELKPGSSPGPSSRRVIAAGSTSPVNRLTASSALSRSSRRSMPNSWSLEAGSMMSVACDSTGFSRPITGLSNAAGSSECVDLLRRHHGIDAGSSSPRPRSVSEPNCTESFFAALMAARSSSSMSWAPKR